MGGGLSEQDLAAAIDGRDDWRLIGDEEALYDPGQPSIVRVGRIRRPPTTGPTRYDRYFAAVVRNGRALHSAQFGFPHQAVAWAERQLLS